MPVVLAEIDRPKWLGEEAANEDELLDDTQAEGKGRHQGRANRELGLAIGNPVEIVLE